MTDMPNADKARELLDNPKTYLDHQKAATARAQVYALLAIADALNAKEH